MKAPALRELTAAELGWLALPLGAPAFTWRARIQPVPLHRARVSVAMAKIHGFRVEADDVFRADLRTLWRDARLRPLEGELAISIVYAGRTTMGPLRRRCPEPDVSNVVKAIEDAGNGFLWSDDRQIKRYAEPFGCAAWGPTVTPFVALTVWRLELREVVVA